MTEDESGPPEQKTATEAQLLALAKTRELSAERRQKRLAVDAEILEAVAKQVGYEGGAALALARGRDAINKRREAVILMAQCGVRPTRAIVLCGYSGASAAGLLRRWIATDPKFRAALETDVRARALLGLHAAVPPMARAAETGWDHPESSRTAARAVEQLGKLSRMTRPDEHAGATIISGRNIQINQVLARTSIEELRRRFDELADRVGTAHLGEGGNGADRRRDGAPAEGSTAGLLPAEPVPDEAAPLEEP